MTTESHREQILDQFTRQAVPFSTSPAVKDEQALRQVVEFSGASADDTVLDVACGPGILACAFARVVRHVTGIDLTPAMLDRARALAAERRSDQHHMATRRRPPAAHSPTAGSRS